MIFSASLILAISKALKAMKFVQVHKRKLQSILNCSASGGPCYSAMPHASEGVG